MKCKKGSFPNYFYFDNRSSYNFGKFKADQYIMASGPSNSGFLLC